VPPAKLTCEANVDIPDTFDCFAKNVLPVTVVIPAKVDAPETSKSAFRSILLWNVERYLLEHQHLNFFQLLNQGMKM